MKAVRSPTISVIVPAWNAQGTLAACLAALAEQTLAGSDYEVIVVDDGSQDRTSEIAKAYGARLLQQEHLGPASARNRGAQEAQGNLLVFTDADCAPQADFLERISDVFQDAQVVGAKGIYATKQRAWIARFVQQEYLFKYERMRTMDSIDFIDTYAAAYRRDVFLTNGGFDVHFPVPSVEDQEFSFRLARKGYRMLFVPGAVVEHRHDQSLGEYVFRKTRIGYWKAHLLGNHPERVMSDTHTPLTQRIQVGLAPVLLLAGLVSPFSQGGWSVFLVSLLAFELSTVPLLISIASNDLILLFAAPWILVFRAFSLAVGLAAGFVTAAMEGDKPQAPMSFGQRLLKRALDVVIASVGLLLTTPLLILAAVAIKLDTPGPVFFTQRRVGEGGRPFTMVKLRTMVKDAEDRLETVLERNRLSGPVFKISNDPRVTRSGRFLRRWSLDELPQFWNVLRGEMSIVGPRPEEAWVVAQYNDWQRKRLAIRPGLTGPMQVSGRGTLDLDQRVRLELDYIEHYSLWKDVQILLRTIPSVVLGQGAI